MQTSARSVHRRLFTRIAAAGLLLAVVAGGLAYLYQRFGRNDKAASQELDRIVSRYFGQDLGLILGELRP